MKESQQINLTPEEVEAIINRLEAHTLTDNDCTIIKAALRNHVILSQAMEHKSQSIGRLLKLLFGGSTEKSKDVLKDSDGDKNKSRSGTFSSELTKEASKKPKGHGRNGACAYTGAEKVFIPHSCLKPGDPCPLCPKGKVYELKEPGVVVRITGKAPVDASVHELQKLRCNLCGQVFTAKEPDEIGEEKYDATAGSMVALLKYGSGVPFNRIEELQNSLGIPLPASTQWDIVEKVADRIHPAYNELIRQGAQGDVLHNDDTPMKILQLMKDADKGHNRGDENDPSRKGVFTTGILSALHDRKIALFFTGRKHAGENMADVLAHRSSGLSPPIQMCDALSRNLPKDYRIILANCLTHGRRNFVDVVSSFPDECQYVIETLAQVYKNDEITKEQNMSAQQRLEFHQTHSGPLMEELKIWLNEQFDEKKVEPNSGLGKAISYMLKHWGPLTLFLRVPKAPLDNNLCEQVLKRAILHRKNALFYKTEHGAYIGDLFMSLIHTCRLNGVNPFEYLTTLQKHSSEVFKHPGKWLPWNYEAAISPAKA